jgi:Flp pilus assembly protein CpaB
MKFAVVLLVVFGVVAAGAATIFVQSLSFFNNKEIPTVDVLVAAGDLEARTPLSEALVESKKLPTTGLPPDYVANWSQVAGKILIVPVVKGQPFASSQFIAKNSVDDLLREGMLAFPVHLSRRVTAENLFYPGCVVDVFATFPLSNRDRGEAVVTPLLQNIRVLGVANETVVSGVPDEKTGQAKRSGGSSDAVVTLEVNSRQAAALQLAMERGTLGLAMRNPNDKGWNPMEPMVVREGQLTAASETLDPQTLAWVTSIQRMLNPQIGRDPNVPAEPNFPKRPVAAPPAVLTHDPNTALNMATAASQPQTVPGVAPASKTRTVELIKASDRKEVEVEKGEEATQEETPAEEAGG